MLVGSAPCGDLRHNFWIQGRRVTHGHLRPAFVGRYLGNDHHAVADEVLCCPADEDVLAKSEKVLDEGVVFGANGCGLVDQFAVLDAIPGRLVNTVLGQLEVGDDEAAAVAVGMLDSVAQGDEVIDEGAGFAPCFCARVVLAESSFGEGDERGCVLLFGVG